MIRFLLFYRPGAAQILHDVPRGMAIILLLECFWDDNT